MMVGRRLFIGNLHSETQRSDLDSALSTICHSGIHEIEIRQKNESTFAFVNLDCGDEANLAKCMAEINKTTVKGQLLKVQIAKENFMERLEKEREGSTQNKCNSYSHLKSSQPQGDSWRRDIRHNQNYNRPPENYDFEIVPVSKIREKESTRPSDSRPSKAEKERTVVRKSYKSDDDDDSGEEEKSGIPMFRGLGFYPGLLVPRTEAQVQVRPEHKFKAPDKVPSPAPLVRNDQISQRMLAIAANQPIPRQSLSAPQPGRMLPPPRPDPAPVASNITKKNAAPSMLMAGGLKLNPWKKEKSDQLRTQSLEWRQQLQQSRSNLIRNALSNSTLQQSDETSASGPKPKKSKKTADGDFLFGKEEDEDPTEDYSIKVKPQYEGKVGQKMLELNANFAWDKRFQIDERFANREEQETPEEEEKNSQLAILGQIIGKTIQKTPKLRGKKNKNDIISESFGFTRYDPTREEHRVFEIEIDDDKEPENASGMEAKSRKVTPVTEVVTEPVPHEKATFKVTPNLKNLFNDTRFSVLGTFGVASSQSASETVENVNGGFEKDDAYEGGGIRSFWNKNPFKYDSSDEEAENPKKGAEDTGAGKKGFEKSKSTEKQRNYFKEDLFKRDCFFFHENDDRLKNVFEEFLTGEEDLEEVRKKFNDLGRSELKTIAKNKRKNSVRKNEKRVKIIRLIRRKKRKEAMKKKSGISDASTPKSK